MVNSCINLSVTLFYSCAPATWLSSETDPITGLCFLRAELCTTLPANSSVQAQTLLLLSAVLTRLSQNLHLPPVTAAWAAVITVCGLNMLKNCWNITAMGETELWRPSRRTFSMTTWRLILKWRSSYWRNLDDGELGWRFTENRFSLFHSSNYLHIFNGWVCQRQIWIIFHP